MVKNSVEGWVIPTFAALTGPYAGVLKEIRWAADEGLKEVNAAGGVAGRPMRFEYYDSASDAAKAHTVGVKGLAKNPLIVLSLDISGGYSGVMDLVVEEEGLFCISVGPGSTAIRDYAPRAGQLMNTIENICYGGVREWLELNPDIERVVILHGSVFPDYVVAGEYMARAVQDAGRTLVGKVPYDEFTTVDFSPVALAALEMNPDGFGFQSLGSPVAQIMIELQRSGVTENRRFLIGLCADYPEWYDMGQGGVFDGSYMSTHSYPDQPDPRWQSIYQRWEEYSGLPATLGVYLGYDVASYFKHAIEETGITGDPAKLTEERQLLADWCYTRDSFPFAMEAAPVKYGMAMRPNYLCVIENDNKVFVEKIPLEEIPEEVLERFGLLK